MKATGNPPHLQRKIDASLRKEAGLAPGRIQTLVSAPGPPAYVHVPCLNEDPVSWSEFCARVRDNLSPFCGSEQRLWLSGLQLVSTNEALRGNKNHNRIGVQTGAKHDVENALMGCPIDQFRRFTHPVRLDIYQHGPSHRIDAPNLWTKSLIDALVDLGVIQDDRYDFVRYAGAGYGDGRLVGVEVMITEWEDRRI